MENAIGIDIGATNIRAVLSDRSGKFLAKVEEKTNKESAEGISRQLIRILESGDISIEDAIGIGIASIGPLDMKKGIISNTPNIPFKEIPLVKPLMKFNLPIYLLNDCNAGVLGERMFGSGKGIKDLIYVTLSTGIGGGICVDNTLLLGKDNNAAEIGHIVIDYEGKLICGCGKPGHWEAYCSGNNIPNFARLLVREKFKGEETTLDLSNLSAETLFNAAKSGDGLALKIVREIGRLNAIGFANLTNTDDPELITVGGSVALNNPELVMNEIKEHIGEYLINRAPRIEITKLGGNICLYGALAAVFNPPSNLKPCKPE